MAAIEIKGSIIHITPEVELKGGFKCRQLVVLEPSQNNSKYDNTFMIQVQTDKYPLLDKFTSGTQVKVHANVDSKPWTNAAGVTSYFVNLKLWKLENTGSAEYTHQESSQQAANTSFNSAPEDEQNLPF